MSMIFGKLENILLKKVEELSRKLISWNIRWIRNWRPKIFVKGDMEEQLKMEEVIENLP